MSEISITEADQRRATEQVLDVREHSEVASGMIPGVIHIPMGQLGQRLNELDAQTPIIVVCRSGNRSAITAEALTSAGYRADTMAGGMIAWTRAGLPTT
ncbi:rhodanese-like domain-containing protein [Planctomonas deserti]|uniref:rhodanese-like domain-containing protein n=1 Tax=Planctomonas deserti TaxID=2144185 RepID=UPI000D38B5A1|nr:rhodanese-like domain-containing protein [Planctomonas deserti]